MDGHLTAVIYGTILRVFLRPTAGSDLLALNDGRTIGRRKLGGLRPPRPPRVSWGGSATPDPPE